MIHVCGFKWNYYGKEFSLRYFVIVLLKYINLYTSAAFKNLGIILI